MLNCIDKRIFLCYNRQVETKLFVFRFADIAQLAEHVIGNDEVGSSNLLNSSREKDTQMGVFFAFSFSQSA